MILRTIIEKGYYKNLKKYISDDPIYQDYIKNNDIELSDFDRFCIDHCVDINLALKELCEQKVIIDETINELKSVQKWLDKYNFDGYYPTLEYRINKLQAVIDDLNNKGGGDSEI